ncbi:hypothetical protein [Frigoribacterium sp. UYMn621]|uniref:hypothetical protein n=1 Tax=Frigoribacterium sp. UYMn621 TaxID=3156343 RepID=UPI0033925B56
MSNITIDDIQNLSETEFDDELDDSIRLIEDFRVFLHPNVIKQTAEYLRNLRDIIDGQLLRHGPAGLEPSDDPTWERRTKGFRGLISSRLHMAQGRIREMANQEGVGSDTAKSREWKRFAHRLAEIVDRLDPFELDLVDVPFCDLSAGEWLDRRLQKQPKRTGVNA